MADNNRMLELLEFFKTNPPPKEVYYAEDVVVQENMQPPRVGRALSIERQKANIRRFE